MLYMYQIQLVLPAIVALKLACLFFLLTQVRVPACQSRGSADARPENSPFQVLDDCTGRYMQLESEANKRNQVE